MGKFRVTQTQHNAHDGLDIVGIDSKEIHATISGVVRFAGWENPNNQKQGFGQYVCIKGADGDYYYYGHLSKINVCAGDSVSICDVIGVEGSTGNSTGSHCHYCIRPQFCKGSEYNTPLRSGIPNAIGEYDDGFRPNDQVITRFTINGVKYKIVKE